MGTAKHANTKEPDDTCQKTFETIAKMDNKHAQTCSRFRLPFFAAVPMASHPFPRFRVLHAPDRYLRLPFRSHVRQMVCLPIVFSEDVLHVVVNSHHGVRDASLPLRMSCFGMPPMLSRYLFSSAQCPLIHCSLELQYPHIWSEVPSLRTAATVLSGGAHVFGSLPSLSALTCSPIWGLCMSECVTFTNAEDTKSCMSILLPQHFLLCHPFFCT